MMNEYRNRINVTASEYSNVMTSALWDSIARLKTIHNPSIKLPSSGHMLKKHGNRENAKAKMAKFQLLRKAPPAWRDKKICYHNMTAKGCAGGADTCSR
jgi:hypothetical protein